MDVRFRRDWFAIAGSEEDREVVELLTEEIPGQIEEEGPEAFLARFEDTLSHVLRISDREQVLLGNFDSTLNRLYEELVPVTVQKYVTHLPVYSCRAAAGRFGDRMQVEEEGWVEAPSNLRLTEDMFIATVTGRSMEPRIPDGSRCIFRHGVTGSRQGRLVLVENLEESEEGGERYTIKRYRSVKRVTEGGWAHEKIVMEPLNPEFERWEIDPEAGEGERIRVLAEFLRVLD